MLMIETLMIETLMIETLMIETLMIDRQAASGYSAFTSAPSDARSPARSS